LDIGHHGRNQTPNDPLRAGRNPGGRFQSIVGITEICKPICETIARFSFVRRRIIYETSCVF
jgi:hypothetical protein